MTTKFLKKSVRLLALLACTSIYNEVSSASLRGDDGFDYAAANTDIPTATRPASYNQIFSLLATGGATTTGDITIGNKGQVSVIASGATGATNTATFNAGSTISVSNGGTLYLLGNGLVDFSGATAFAGPTTTGQTATLSLWNAPGTSSSAAIDSATVIPGQALGTMTGLWTISSQNDAAAIDVDGDGGGIPACTVNLARNLYFGGVAGSGGTQNAAYFGGAGAVVTGSGTLTLGGGFGGSMGGVVPTSLLPSFSATFTAFTGAVRTTRADGNLHFNSAIGATGALLLGAAGPVHLNVASTIGTVVAESTTAAELYINAATTINNLYVPNDLNIRFPSTTTAVALIVKSILAGSDGRITVYGPGAGTGTGSLTVQAGRTSGGVVVDPTNAARVTCVLPN